VSSLHRRESNGVKWFTHLHQAPSRDAGAAGREFAVRELTDIDLANLKQDGNNAAALSELSQERIKQEATSSVRAEKDRDKVRSRARRQVSRNFNFRIEMSIVFSLQSGSTILPVSTVA
jgi:hypothetical protein